MLHIFELQDSRTIAVVEFRMVPWMLNGRLYYYLWHRIKSSGSNEPEVPGSYCHPWFIHGSKSVLERQRFLFCESVKFYNLILNLNRIVIDFERLSIDYHE